MKNLKIYFLIAFAVIGLSAHSQTAYIVNNISRNVSVINLTTNTVTGTIPVGANPYGVSVSPDGSKVYVANYNTNGTVSVISTATNTVEATVPVGQLPQGVTVSPDGSKVYVANWNDNTVSIINSATNTVLATSFVGHQPYGIYASPDGTKVYVTNSNDYNISVINTSTNFVSAIIHTGTLPTAVCVSPDSRKVYVVNQISGTVSVIDTVTFTVTDSILVNREPVAICVSPDGTKLYVSKAGDSTVSVINTATNTVSAIIPVGNTPISLGNFISPLNTACSAQFLLYADTTQAHHYFINNNAFGVQPLHYLWNWGDGNTDTIPYPSHTYLDSGVYTICLTITDSTGCQSIFCDSSYHIMRTSDYMVTINVISNIMTDIKHIVANNTISVYPNPASSTITIHQSTPSPNQQLLITNILGEEIYHQAINNSTQTTIDISHWSNGVYFYQIRGDKETVQGKFVKEK